MPAWVERDHLLAPPSRPGPWTLDGFRIAAEPGDFTVAGADAPALVAQLVRDNPRIQVDTKPIAKTPLAIV
jgi:hypothetical protein